MPKHGSNRRSPGALEEKHAAASHRSLEEERKQSRGASTRCARCGSPFACPVDWQRAPADKWRIRFRCGACEHFQQHVLGEPELEQLDRALDTAERQIVAS